MTKKYYLSSSILLLALLLALIGSSASANPAARPSLDGETWLDRAWSYRRPVSIPNPCGLAQSNYPVQIKLDNSFDFTKTQPGGTDIRITSNDGVTQLPFWIESWEPGNDQANIWVKLPILPIAGATIYIYYGNPSPGQAVLEMPPTGPWTKAAGNPIIASGGPANGRSLLAENIVYDPATQHHWMVLANYNNGSVSLVWSDTPTDPASWHWQGDVVASANAPHILFDNGKWYIFFSDWTTGEPSQHSIQTVEATTITGPYTNRQTVLSPVSGTWENWRVDEPYVFKRNDGKWILLYMGDSGDYLNGQRYYEQVGYAVADNLTGPYTKYAGNPALAWGSPGTFDAGTIADPWVVEFHGTYYIGYTVSSTIYSPWQTAIATTTNWTTFNKQGIILPLGSSGAWDAANTFRGAVTRIGDTYVFAYTGDAFQMGIATQPVFQQNNNQALIFPFFDEFNDGSFDLSKWSITDGTISQVSEGGGQVTLTGTSAAYIKIIGSISFSMDYLVEARARHPEAGTNQLIPEIGWMGSGFGDAVRIASDFHNTTYWERQVKRSSEGDNWHNMAQTVDTSWHSFRIYRLSPNSAGFQIDSNSAEVTNGSDTTTTVPTSNLPAFLMSYGYGNQLIVDWLRVRPYCGADPLVTVSAEEPRPLISQVSLDKTGDAQIVSGSTANFTITVTNSGDYALTDVSISDPLTPNCNRQYASLAIGRSESFSCSVANVVADLINVASVTAQSVPGSVSAADSFGVDVIHPNLAINLTPDSQTIYSGQNASFSVQVTNTGGIALESVEVADAQGQCAHSIGHLAQGASSTYTCSVTDVTSGFSKTVIATGIPPLGNQVTAADTAEVTLQSLNDAPWMDTAWHYRRAILVGNQCSQSAGEYQVQITLDSSFDFGKAKPSGADLRVTSSDGVTQIPFWIESWDAPNQAKIWTKAPALPISGTAVYIYYGNPSISGPALIETPPTGPWTKAAGNPIVPISDPANGQSLLAENIVYDSVTDHYWMVHANYNEGGVGLVWSDTPTDPASWHWHGTVVAAANAPHILYNNGKWYIFFSDWSTPWSTTRHSLQYVESTDITGPYTNRTTVLSPQPYTWENWRVDEPFVFKRNDDKWILVYMADQGDFEHGQFYYEQVGYAIADNLTGPYTKFSGNPMLAWGPPGSFDAGTIADPWVVEYHGTYYIGYTVSPTISSPWQTAVATTTDWITFNKLGVILPLSPSGWDSVNTFRGAVTRIDDTYVFSYTGDGYQMGIATQPVYQPEPINDPDAVFGFYDDFTGTQLDNSKWSVRRESANNGTVTVSGGNLTLHAEYLSGQYDLIELVGTQSFGPGTLLEASARHPQASGSGTTAAELGFGDALRTNLIRILDYNNPNFIKNTAAGGAGGEVYNPMAHPIDNQNYLLHRIYRTGNGQARFALENDPWETITANVPTVQLPVWLMTYSSPTPTNLEVDWVHVRNWCGADATTSLQAEQFTNWAPTPLNDSASTTMSTPVTINVAINDSDPDSNLAPASAAPFSAPAHGSAVSNGDGTITYTPVGGFMGSDSFTYQVCDTGPLCATASVNVMVALPLHSGWNLVSLNQRPTDTQVEAVLASLGASYDLVYAWDASSGIWQRYARAVPIGNTLTNIDEKMGFWVHMLSAAPLSIPGSTPTVTNISLVSGWNLVGCPALDVYSLPAALSEHGVGNDYSMIYAYHAGESDPWKLFDRSAPVWANDLTVMTPAWGYWVQATTPHNWYVEYP